MRLTVVGCAGSFPVRTVRRRATGGARRRGSSSTWATVRWGFAAACRHLRHRRRPAVPSSRRPLHRPDVLLRRPQVSSGRRPRAHSGLRSRGTADRMASAYGLSSRPGMHDEFNFMRHAADATAIGPFTVETIRVAHPVETYAIRVSADGRSLVYSVTPAPRSLLSKFPGRRSGGFRGLVRQWPRESTDLHLTGGGPPTTRSGRGRTPAADTSGCLGTIRSRSSPKQRRPTTASCCWPLAGFS